MLRPFVLAVSLLMLVTASSAADRIVIEHGASPLGANDQVRVNVSMTFFVPAPTDATEASVKAQEHARKLLYESAGKECGNLRAAIARDCRLESDQREHEPYLRPADTAGVQRHR